MGGAGCGKNDIAMGLVDESSPQNRANTVRVWSFEKSPKAIKNTTHFKSNTIGFYAIYGSSVQSFLDNSKKESIADFFKHVRAANTSVKAMIVILDNYSSHISEQVARTAQALSIYLVFCLPTLRTLIPLSTSGKALNGSCPPVSLKHLTR
jgi:hypothetical protein